jgi:predicted dehydrogenase
MTKAVTGIAPDLNVAIVGGGFMSEVHARAVRAAGGRLLGVATSNVTSAATAARVISAERAYGSVAELLADERVEVVHVCTPNVSHFSIVEAAILARKHVVCEKPLATSADEARILVSLLERRSLVGTIPFVYRYHPMIREARSRIARGEVGRLFSIRGEYLQDWLWRSGDDDWRVDPQRGGPSRAFADIGSHLCDLVEFVTGDSIVRLCAQVSTVHPSRSTNDTVLTEDVATVIFQTELGVLGTLHVSQVAAGYKNSLTIELLGERQSMAFDQEQPERLRIGTKQGFMTEFRGLETASDEGGLSFLPAGHAQGYQDAFNSFVSDVYRSIRGEAVDGLPTFHDGRRAAVLTDAVLNSHSTNKWIETPLLDFDLSSAL